MKRVLVVDDNAENLYMLRALLQGHGYEVDEARHGAEALVKARKEKPDIIISDLLMPVMDGYMLLRRWKDDDDMKNVPFIVYTATYTDPKDEKLAIDLGADAFLLKPAEPDVFMGVVQQVLGRENSARQPEIETGVQQGGLLKEYNATLIRKLEKKALELELANRELHEEIAERKRTEAELRGSEDRYHKLFDAIIDPLFVYDRETLRYLAVNDAATHHYGYSREEFLRMTIKDIRPKEDIPALLDMLAGSGEGVESRGTWRHRKKNGEVFEVEISAYGMTFSGRPACVIQARDVTEQRRAAAEIVRTTELLQSFLNGTPDVVYVKDLKGKYLLFNDAGSRYVGKSVEDVLGKDDTAIFGEVDALALMKNDREVMASNRDQIIEEKLVTALGPRTFQTMKAPYRDSKGKVIGLIGIARDVTHLKSTEETLRLRDRAIEAVSQGILITDPNQPDNPIIYASAGFEAMTGYRIEEVLGKNCRFLQGEDSDPETVDEIRRALKEGKKCSVEIMNYRKDGTAFWNQLTIAPVLGEKDDVTHFVGVQTDVTPRRQLEEQLRQAQKMEAFGQLAGGVAHDFNNLLTVIAGYSQLLLGKLFAPDPIREAVVEISEAGERAASLTRQLLAFSRQTVLAPKVLNLNGVVGETEKMLRRLMGEDVVLGTVFDPKINLVRVDPGHMAQVLMNLAVNARDAMPKGGKLTIETSNFLLDETYALTHPDVTPGDYVMLAVSDTGCGIPKELKNRIFEPFFTTKEFGKGTGLGLAVVHGIIKQSGGNIEVYSEIGVGTTFKIYFPAVKDEPISASPSPDAEAGHGTETVLLVEDDDAVRGLAALVLETHGYKVMNASGGTEALRLADALGDKFAILVTDVVMPGMGGVELADTLQSRFPKLKILFLSGYTDDAIVRHGILHEKVAFLQKPFSPDRLARKVRDVLDGK